MRAPFDRFIDTYFGPHSGAYLTPKLIAAPSRLVNDLAFVDVMDPLNTSFAYITIDEALINPPTVTPIGPGYWLQDSGQADLIALTTGGPITHQCGRAERRTWPTGTNYWRCHIIPRADVPPSPCSITYPDEFQFLSGATPWVTLARLGPTAWFGDDWLLLAEVDGPPDGACQSLWTIYRNDKTWVTDYDGLTNQLFISADGGVPTAIAVHPVP